MLSVLVVDAAHCLCCLALVVVHIFNYEIRNCSANIRRYGCFMKDGHYGDGRVEEKGKENFCPSLSLSVEFLLVKRLNAQLRV